MATKKVEVELDGAKKTVEVKSPPKKKCNITDFLPRSVIDLVKSAPNNETIRNLLLAHLKVPVPREEDTFEKVKNWIEYNCEIPPKPKSSWELEMERQQAEQERLNAAAAERRRTQVMVEVVASEREHGRCSYHNTREGRGQMGVCREALIEAASEASDSDEFFDLIASKIDEDSPSDYLTMRDVEGTAEYDDHEFDETTDSEITIQDAGKTALKDALRTADPALFAELFPNG